MSFEAILQRIVDECGGGLAAALMGSDGIPIQEVVASAPPARVPFEEIGSVGAEFVRVLDELRKASDALSGGGVVETLASFARFVLLCRVVDEDIFVLLAVSPDGNLGKARYLLRRHLLALREEL